MKNRWRTILFCLISIGLVLFCSCRRGHGGRNVPTLKIDSLFVDLGKTMVEKRATAADHTFTEMQKNGILNGVVLYAEEGQVVLKKAFGWRNLVKKQDSLRVDDQFQLASVSKMFTAEAIMLIHSQGKLDYDDPITKFIPEFPYQGITVRHLLNHRSGLSRYETLADETWPDRGIPIGNEDIIKLYVQHNPLPYNQPGITFHYTNVNYALLASIVERVSGKHFEDFMKEEVFDPLGMSRSYIYSMRDSGRLHTYVNTEVQGHIMMRQGPKRVEEDYLNGVMGDKMMYSTVDDLYKFCLALERNSFLPDSIQRQAFLPGSEEWKNGENYGFGWRMNEKHPGVLFHFGWWKGYRSFFIRDLEKHRVLIVLTNTSSSAVGESLWEFINDTTVRLPESCALKN
ncbi:MAG: beta-lactamase family protein [Bacteroidales bacterium]|nr:beta-lactamase family protein [Bacteroidales bacterium]